MRRLKWLGAFAIDSRSIALFVFLGAVFQLGNGVGNAYLEDWGARSGGLIGLLLAVVAVKLLGWSSVAMLRRYLGKIPVAQLKRYPTTLERVIGRAG